jgi:hypothetical protein
MPIDMHAIVDDLVRGCIRVRQKTAFLVNLGISRAHYTDISTAPPPISLDVSITLPPSPLLERSPLPLNSLQGSPTPRAYIQGRGHATNTDIEMHYFLELTRVLEP